MSDSKFKKIFMPNKAKNHFMNEAWEYFKEKEGLYPWLTLDFFNIHWKDENLKERWGAFRHMYTSAAFTQNYNSETVSKVFGDANEIIQFGSKKSYPSLTQYNAGNTPPDRRMDLKNNAEGRKIAKQYDGVNLLDAVYYNLDTNPNVVLNENTNNDEPFNDNAVMNKIWEAADNGYYEKKWSEFEKNAKNPFPQTGPYKNNGAGDYDSMFLTGQIEYNKPRSLKEKLVNAKEEKLARYTKKLAESPEKVRAQEAKHVTLEELKAPQNSRIQKVHDMIQNAHKKKDENKLSSSGEVYVKEYTRSDGTKVKSYYRSR